MAYNCHFTCGGRFCHLWYSCAFNVQVISYKSSLHFLGKNVLFSRNCLYCPWLFELVTFIYSHLPPPLTTSCLKLPLSSQKLSLLPSPRPSILLSTKLSSFHLSYIHVFLLLPSPLLFPLYFIYFHSCFFGHTHQTRFLGTHSNRSILFIPFFLFFNQTHFHLKVVMIS